MEYMNIVRMNIRDGKFDEWRNRAEQNLAAFRDVDGLVNVSWVETGDRAICVVGRWRSEAALGQARPKMKAMLDQIRDLLEPMSDGSITGPVSGPVILGT
jgi:quinol monooxygenase YgiN